MESIVWRSVTGREVGGETKRGISFRLSTRVSRSHATGDFHARTRVLFLPLSQYQHSYSPQSSPYIRWENLKIVKIFGDHFVYAHVLNARQAVELYVYWCINCVLMRYSRTPLYGHPLITDTRYNGQFSWSHTIQFPYN